MEFFLESKAKKSKIIDVCPDSDSDFETNSSQLTQVQNRAAFQKKSLARSQKARKHRRLRKEEQIHPQKFLIETLLIKFSGPIAPIFLPGAWRRAKTKLEEAERLEAQLEVVEIEENSSSLQGSQTSKLPTQDEDDNPCIVNSSENSTTNNVSTSSMAVFLSLFQKPTPKPSTMVVQLIEAPFPKVTHVRQQDDEKDTKWNLPMIRNRFIKEEYFFMLDSNGSIKERNLSSWFRGIGISCSEEKTTVDSKCIQLKVVLEMDKSQKQKIVSYLKTIYQGVPVKRLFKRCEHQLELCEKSLMENENIASLVVQKESFKRAQVPSIKGPAVPASNFTKLQNTQVPEKMESFTKISRKKTKAKVKAKAEKKKESPLFLAFKNQENASNNKTEEIVKAKSKKERVKKTSIMDFMGIQTKESENISEIKRR
ncbi:Hypothetical predicted protein [Paramuricea clavata]|uniref:Uncharacterized protein n=1 Tax=Paramuricea clavata TaxID=317549 RepID=A0A7D9L6U4_PARCT|nr:Hypothetical predicted protein [Paramuricea clavata]